MNSNYGKGSSGSGNFNFDLGFGSNRPVSLKDQKNPTSSSSFSSYSSTTTQPKPAWQPNKPSWTHQPAPAQPTRTGLNGPTSMVGDIHGKSWNSTGSGIGIADKNPNLFGDLVSSALGQGIKGNSNVPLKNAAPTSKNSAYSMGNLADSLPKSSISGSVGGNRGSSGGFGYTQASSNVNSAFSGNGNANFSSNKSTNLGGPSMKSMAGGGGGGVGLGGNKDPFGSLVDLASKPSSGSLNTAAKNGSKPNANDDSFGVFQNAAKPSTQSAQTSGFGANTNDFTGPNTGFSSSIDDFGFGSNGFASQKQPPVQTTNEDPLNMFFSPSSGNTATASGGSAGDQLSGLDDWGMEPDFSGAGGDSGAATTELEGLPPPPAGVSAAAAKSKGIDNQKQGQYADAIKWLSWAVVLLEKSGDSAGSMEVLSCRASCYKEVGEYKKAVADCTKVLEFDDKNTSALVQRALLYESMEKYKLGAEDLRTVLKIDPANRIARSTIHRLTKMVS